ncbi:hypothetical protein LIA77_00045 [Sarocladium implicatum]|nr:hypothetical protein LIA77_00045 [Sarocladium implicatum]
MELPDRAEHIVFRKMVRHQAMFVGTRTASFFGGFPYSRDLECVSSGHRHQPVGRESAASGLLDVSLGQPVGCGCKVGTLRGDKLALPGGARRGRPVAPPPVLLGQDPPAGHFSAAAAAVTL